MSRAIAGLVSEFAKSKGYTNVRFTFDGYYAGVIAAKPHSAPLLFAAVSEKGGAFDMLDAGSIGDYWGMVWNEQVTDVVPLEVVPNASGLAVELRR